MLDFLLCNVFFSVAQKELTVFLCSWWIAIALLLVRSTRLEFLQNDGILRNFNREHSKTFPHTLHKLFLDKLSNGLLFESSLEVTSHTL